LARLGELATDYFPLKIKKILRTNVNLPTKFAILAKWLLGDVFYFVDFFRFKKYIILWVILLICVNESFINHWRSNKISNTAGSSPLLVTCDDFNDWVCKYDRFPKQFYLMNCSVSEFKLWNINTQKTAFIKKVKNRNIYLLINTHNWLYRLFWERMFWFFISLKHKRNWFIYLLFHCLVFSR
jgi:hypothetical protein